MKYDISKATAPAIPNLGKGTECIRLLLSQTSKDMHEPLVPMLFPVLGAHISGAEFQYPDLENEKDYSLRRFRLPNFPRRDWNIRPRTCSWQGPFCL